MSEDTIRLQAMQFISGVAHALLARGVHDFQLDADIDREGRNRVLVKLAAYTPELLAALAPLGRVKGSSGGILVTDTNWA